MLEDISNETYGNENLLQEQLRLQARRQRQIEAAKEAQRQAGINSQGRMIGNTYVKAPKLAAFVPIVQQLAAHVEDRAYDEQNRALNSRITKAQAEHLRAYPGPDADTKAALEWSMRGAQIPGMQPVMEKFLQDRLVAAPEREAARQYKAEQAAAALAEKKERQERELEYRRESDRIRSEDRRYQTDQMTGLRRDLAGAMASRLRSGGNGSALLDTDAEGIPWKTVKNPAGKDIVSKDNDDGTTTFIYKPTLEAITLPGKLARASAAVTKKEQDAATQQGSSQDALADIGNAKKLLPNATGSGIGAGIDMLYRGVGATNEGMKANRQLKVISGRLTATVPRFEGPQSEKDVLMYKEQAADVGNESLTTSERLEALKQVELMHKRVLQNSGRTKAAARGDTGPSIREAVEAASQKQGSKSIDDLLNKYK